MLEETTAGLSADRRVQVAAFSHLGLVGITELLQLAAERVAWQVGGEGNWADASEGCGDGVDELLEIGVGQGGFK